MLISTLFERLDEIQPHQYSEAVLLMWTKELEKDIADYINSNYANADADISVYDALTTADDTLIDEPSLYLEFLQHKIDFGNGEFERANNHAAMHNALLANWREKYFRENRDSLTMPRFIRGL